MVREQWVLVVEDLAGEAVLRRLIHDIAPAWDISLVDNCEGITRMRKQIAKYRNASHVTPHLLLADLDQHACPNIMLDIWGIRSQPPRLIVRVAVREVESWLLGDRAGVSSWLQVPAMRIPDLPEAELDPKATLLALARKSRSRRFAAEFCPAPGSAASQGPLYNDHLTKFVRESWNWQTACSVVPSLRRACQRIIERASMN